MFEFGRCLVHFAVDPDEAYMCAQLVELYDTTGTKNVFDSVVVTDRRVLDT